MSAAVASSARSIMQGSCVHFPVSAAGGAAAGVHSFLQMRVPRPRTGTSGANSKATQPEIVFVVDRSGSMAGSPIRAVNGILCDLHEMCVSASLAMPTVIEYDQRTGERSLVEVVARPVVASGGTSFAAAYKAMIANLQRFAERRRRAPKGEQSIGQTFLFMSDGEDCGDANATRQIAEEFTGLTKQLNAEFGGVAITVHVIGLGRGVHEALLSSVSQMGNVPGAFRYSAASDSLADKFRDLFEYELSECPCRVFITPKPGADGQAREEVCVDASARIVDQEPTTTDDAPQLSRRDAAAALIAAKAAGEVVEAKPAVAATVEEGGQVYVIELLLPTHCVLEEGAQVSVAMVGSEQQFNFTAPAAVASPSAQQLLTALELLEPATPEATAELIKRVGCILTRSRRINERIALESQRGALLQRLTSIMQLLNAQKFDADAGSALRLRDLRAEHKFVKGRRARMMALREAESLKQMATMQGRLEKTWAETTQLQLAELDHVSAAGGWSCLLSLQSAAELMRSSLDDFLCVGLLVVREESVVDSPQTGLRLVSVAKSLVSFNTFADAMTLAKAEKGYAASVGALKPNKRGGGQDVNGAQQLPQAGDEEDDDVAFCFVGQARDKINAVFPLFLCEAHMRRVMLLRQCWLPYLFTLDAMAFDKQQEVGALALLAQVVSQFDGTSAQAVLAREMAAVCACMMQRSDSFAQAFPPERLEAFVHTVDGRQKQHVPNLATPVIMAFLGDQFNVRDFKRAKKTAADASASSAAASSSDASPDPAASDLSSVLTLTADEMLSAVYLAFTQRLVRNAYAALQVESMKKVALLLYGPPASARDKTAAAQAKGGANGSGGEAPYAVRLEAALAEFAASFYDSSLPVPTLPKRDEEEKKVAAEDGSSLRRICASELVATEVAEFMPPVPKFLTRLLLGMDQLVAKWREQGLDGRPPAEAGEKDGESDSMLDRASQLIFRADDDSPAGRDLLEAYRRHLLICFYYHNDSPPAHITPDVIMSVAHERLEARAHQQQSAVAVSEQHHELASLMCAADDLAAFGALLRFFCPTRNGPVFRLLVAQLIHRADREKLRALLSNRVDSLPLYCSPQLEAQVWLPAGLGLHEHVALVMGKEQMQAIQKEHVKRKRTRGHVYRASDKPNRCGHCNSIPYKGHFTPFKEF